METLRHILFVAIVVYFVQFSASQNILEQFVQNKLEDYGTWINSKNRDPSELIPGPTPIQAATIFTRVDAYLSNHIVKDHSKHINVTSVKADLERIIISYAFEENVTFSGKYVANGTSWDIKNFTGEGNWSIVFPQISFRNMHFNYSVDNLGHVYFTHYNLDGIVVPDQYNYDATVNFENIRDADTGEVAEDTHQIDDALYEGFRTYLMKEQDHPLKQMFAEYLREVFSNTTWAEIILYPTEPANNSTSSTTPSSPENSSAEILRKSKYLTTVSILIVYLWRQVA